MRGWLISFIGAALVIAVAASGQFGTVDGIFAMIVIVVATLFIAKRYGR